MKYLATALLILSAVQTVWANNDKLSKNDFAFGQSIETMQGPGIYQVRLNDDVYQNIVNEDLGDIRVIDGKGNSMPYLVLSKAGSDANNKSAVTVPVFPLMGNYKVGLQGFSVHIKRNKQGNITSIQTSRDDYEASDIVGYLVDLNSVSEPVERLILKWKDLGKKKTRKLTAAGSNTLDKWKTVQIESPYGHIVHSDKVFLRDEVAIGGSKYRQLHISWKDMRYPVTISQAKVITDKKSANDERKWNSVTGVVSEENPSEFLFDTGGRFPVDRIQLKPFPVSAAFQVRLFSKASVNGRWELVKEFDYYSLKVDGKKIKSLPVILPATRHRYWRMDFVNVDRELKILKPEMAFGWIPERLLFQTQGDGTYALVYGHAHARSDDPVDPAFIQKIKMGDIKKTVTIDRIVLAGKVDESEIRSNTDDSSIRNWLKWIVLITGIIILALLLAKLLRRPGDQEN